MNFKNIVWFQKGTFYLRGPENDPSAACKRSPNWTATDPKTRNDLDCEQSLSFPRVARVAICIIVTVPRAEDFTEEQKPTTRSLEMIPQSVPQTIPGTEMASSPQNKSKEISEFSNLDSGFISSIFT